MAEDFIPGVKGIGYTPGSGGWPNIVPTGNSAIGNAIEMAGKGGSGATSYWWSSKIWSTKTSSCGSDYIKNYYLEDCF
jgi:hypothetical protein